MVAGHTPGDANRYSACSAFLLPPAQCVRRQVSGQSFGTVTTTPRVLNFLRLEETLSAAHLRLASAWIEHETWQACIDLHDRLHTFFYLYPPFWKTEGYGTPFGMDQYLDMARSLRQIRGKAIVSLNHHPDIREAFNGFHIETTDYTVGGGAGVRRNEVLIFSWNVQEEPSGLF